MNLLLLAVVALLLLAASPAHTAPIISTLDGCVTLTDPRLAEAAWSATGTFQAVAFDDALAGCDTTIETPISDAFLFDEDRWANTLKATLNLNNVPVCGRRQYDLHFYLDAGVLDPFGLKSLVIDTGIDCGHAPPPVEPPPSVPEPGALLLFSLGAIAWRRFRQMHPGDTP